MDPRFRGDDVKIKTCAIVPVVRDAGASVVVFIPQRPCALEVFLIRAIIMRARGTPDALNASAASRAKVRKHTSIVTTVTPLSPGVPHAMVFERLAPRTGPPEADPCVVPPFMAQGGRAGTSRFGPSRARRGRHA